MQFETHGSSNPDPNQHRNIDMNEEIKKQLHNDTAILEPQACFNVAIVDVEDQRLVYDYDLIVNALMDYYDWTYIDAVEWMEYNVKRSLPYMGEYAPIIVEDDEI